ncbi:MAG: hypothetical protein EOO59_16065, partial [Hymenobacter sp.]
MIIEELRPAGRRPHKFAEHALATYILHAAGLVGVVQHVPMALALDGRAVARAKNLLGPWEKYARNPILTKNDTWTCPGHGTAIERNGHWYMLHHAYQT